MNNFNFSTEKAIKYNDKIYFWSSKSNGLYQYDEITGEMILVTSFPKTDFAEAYLFSEMIRVGENFYIASKSGSLKFAIYNIISDEWKIFNICDYYKNEKYMNSMSAFAELIYHGDYIYLIGCMVPLVVRFNINTYEIIVLDEWTSYIDMKNIPEFINGKIWDENKYKQYNLPTIYFTHGSIYNNIAYYPMRCGNWLLKLDLDTSKTEIITINSCVESFQECIVIDDELWMLGCYQHVIVIYNLNNQSIREVRLSKDVSPTIFKSALFEKPIVIDEKVYILPATSEYAYCVNKNNYEVEQFCEKNDFCHTEIPGRAKNKIILIDGSKVYYISNKTQKWFCYDLINMQAIELHINYDASIVERYNESVKIIKWKNTFKKTIIEDEETDLKQYLHMLSKM